MLEVLSNPLCSKCRHALAFLDSHGLAYTTREYLKDPLTLEELRLLSVKLELPPKEWMRQVVGATLEEQLESVVRQPELLQRPIVVSTDRAVVARTAESLRSLLDL